MFLLFCFSVLLVFLFLCLYNKDDNHVCNFIGATGSSDNHALYLPNVLYSFAINNPHCTLYCYNLDLNGIWYNKIKLDVILTNKYLRKIKSKGKVFFNNYTQNVYTQQFAAFSMSFKPTILYRLLNKYHKTIIWMDAGTEILKPLDDEVRIAKKYGFYMDRNPALLLDWVHPSAIIYFNFSRNMFIGLHDTEAGFLTVDYNIDFMKKIIEPWYECSKHRECICPKNFTYKYYRRDQPALSMLLYNSSTYSKYVGKEEIKGSHIKQCDHRKGCNILSNYVKILKKIIE